MTIPAHTVHTAAKSFAITLMFVFLFALTGNTAFANAIIFSDNFSGPTLNAAWVQLPGTGSVTVGNGKLQYNNQGPIASPPGWDNTSFSLLLPFPLQATTGKSIWKLPTTSPGACQATISTGRPYRTSPARPGRKPLGSAWSSIP